MTIFPKETKFDYLKPTIINIMELAREKREESKSEEEQDCMNASYMGRQGKSKELYEYLCQLEEKDIQKILAIMYIGRDGIYYDDNGKSTYKGFDDYMKGFNHIYSQGKEIVASQISQKISLDKYLYNGCKHLKIEL